MLRDKLTSRKFIMAVLGALLALGNTLLDNPIPTEDLLMIEGVIGTYIIGEGIADHGGRV